MVSTMVIKVVVMAGEVVTEAGVGVEGREEGGKEGGARLTTKEVSLYSTSSMEATSIIILDLDREEIIPVEATEPYILPEFK
jgi:hypothetical protein